VYLIDINKEGAGMTILANEIQLAKAQQVSVNDAERNNWRLIGQGEGIHWPDPDEELSVEGLLAGRRSGESQNSLQRWLEQRAA
jgi:hypothetical protein